MNDDELPLMPMPKCIHGNWWKLCWCFQKRLAVSPSR